MNKSDERTNNVKSTLQTALKLPPWHHDSRFLSFGYSYFGPYSYYNSIFVIFVAKIRFFIYLLIRNPYLSTS